MGLMEAFFYVIPGIFVVVGVLGVVRTLGRSSEISRAWRHGRTAEARCLRSYTTTSGGGGDAAVTTTLHHVYEFTTAEGRTVRIDEANGRSTVVEGDFVTVHYLPEHPEKATARPPAQGRLAVGTGCTVAFFVVFIVFALVFMGTAHFFFSEADGFAP
ncbi:DUF3592 domain-containing protein [Streptomyces shenzhenensis]|uniref:DUF3592 domain-containing protein n=1 Tax=Streptomyces shenzhenensis TaxID=943815 RepID=UPI00286815D3|nr:DUF3592 domain-containing protein [Streptomyces shenzhenensis]